MEIQTKARIMFLIWIGAMILSFCLEYFVFNDELAYHDAAILAAVGVLHLITYDLITYTVKHIIKNRDDKSDLCSIFKQ